MPIQDITLFGLLLPAIPLKMVAVNFRYTALAGLIRQIHQMARHTGEQTRPLAILYREMRMLETRFTFVKSSLFSCKMEELPFGAFFVDFVTRIGF